MRRGLHSAIAVLAVLTWSVPEVSAELPTYDGAMSFPDITGPLSPEEISWEVSLGTGQELKAIDDRRAGIYFTDSQHLAGTITAEEAHDSVGSDVPTNLGVSGGDVITLIVHHRAGNPAANGAPFVYPVTAGPGWEGGFVTHQVQMPPPEAQPRPAPAAGSAVGCVVPQLRGRTLKGAKRRLGKADCKIGQVRRRKNATSNAARVVRQNPKPGALLAPGAAVSVTLAA